MSSPRPIVPLLLTALGLAALGCGNVAVERALSNDAGSLPELDAGRLDLNARGETIKTGTDDGGAQDLVDAECSPGERGCNGQAPRVCDETGHWQEGAACATACRDGACTVCSPGAVECSGNIPRTCNAAGQWESGETCPFVCAEGQCTGDCVPAARDCADLVPRVCDAAGQWHAEAACPYVCSEGVCGGVCVPGAAACDGNVPLACGSTGDWQRGQSCPFVCADGACAGSCAPGARQCRGNVPQTCGDNGQWQEAAACPFVCADGACAGTCVPGARRCSSGRNELCDASGTWREAPTTPRELLVNPSFDAASTEPLGWIQDASSVLIYDQSQTWPATAAHSPPRLAWLGGLNDLAEDLWQTVAVPSATTRLVLSFQYRIQTEESILAPYDSFWVEVRGANGTLLQNLAPLSNMDASDRWSAFSAVLPSTFAGQTIQLHLRDTTDFAAATHFFVDTVSLQATLCE